MAVLMFSALYFIMLVVCTVLCDSTVRVTFHNRDLQALCLRTLFLYVLTTVYRHCVYALRTRDTFTNCDLPVGCFLSTTVEVLTLCLIYEMV